MWPLAFSTLGLLNRLKRDILLEALRSSAGSGLREPVCARLGVGWRFCSSRFALDRLRRHREVVGRSLEAMACKPERNFRDQHINVARRWRLVAGKRMMGPRNAGVSRLGDIGLYKEQLHSVAQHTQTRKVNELRRGGGIRRVMAWKKEKSVSVLHEVVGRCPSRVSMRQSSGGVGIGKEAEADVNERQAARGQGV